MSSSTPEPEEELFLGFLEESDELVNDVEISSTALLKEPEDFEHIHGIFRAVHSLKGNSGIFNIRAVQSFCHAFENYMELLRDKSINLDTGVINFIIEGSDYLKNIFTRLSISGREVDLNNDENTFLEKLENQISQHTSDGKREKLRIELLQFFNKATSEGRMGDDSHLKDLYDSITGIDPELLKDRRKSSAVTKEKWMIGESDVTREYIDLNDLVNRAISGEMVEDTYNIFINSITGLMKQTEEAGASSAVEVLLAILGEFETLYQEELGMDEFLGESLKELLDKYAEYLTMLEPNNKTEPADVSGNGKRRESVSIDKSVRVNEILLDEFIGHVGELITLNELFSGLQKRLDGGETNNLSHDFKSTNQAFHELSGLLQKSLYEIRKAPLEQVFSKLPRVLRGVTKNTGKSTSLVTTGGDIEMDKSLLGKIETVLVHCVRNSADHGIETQQERTDAGKKAEGQIHISAWSDKNRVFLKISDDGNGVNVEKIRAHAIKNGFASAEDAVKLSDKDILDILMKPGFSTASSITETSGRGVGMDVLWSSVYEMGGELSLDNKPGLGLTINISVPLAYTTRIKLGLTMRVGDNIFLIPAENVRESFRVAKDDVNTIEGKGEVVSRWGRVYSLVRLSNLLNIPSSYNNVWDAICMLVDYKGTSMCLLVDEILGQRQIVYKELTVQTREPCVFEGVSILDGRSMALILNVGGIIKQFEE
ncbi:Signal transduction histidine kinase CheA [hydrothermal vent metagenome]|uniref:histidine kinase n=1 Tax=hydrothermal vent metagenome TaxID=652676 RepID=A0A3B1BYE1_9ZZZZ